MSAHVVNVLSDHSDPDLQDSLWKFLPDWLGTQGIGWTMDVLERLTAEQRVKMYADWMATPGVWGGELELAQVSWAYGVDYEVWWKKKHGGGWITADRRRPNANV